MKKANKKASFNYKFTGERYEAGISLLGAEVKSIRKGHVNLNQSVVRILGGEVYLINADIPAASPPRGYNSKRPRKLLLNKKEIVSISTKVKQQKLTLVPTKIYTKRDLVKIEVALGKTKKKFEKREVVKKRDIEREIEHELRGKI